MDKVFVGVCEIYPCKQNKRTLGKGYNTGAGRSEYVPGAWYLSG